MTIQRDATGTAQYIPPALGSTPDVFGLARSTPIAPYTGAPSPPKFGIWPIAKDMAGNPTPGLHGFRLPLYDARGGLNRTRGFVDRDHARLASSTMVTYFEEHGIHPFLTSKANTGTPTTSTIYYMTTANAFGTFAFAVCSLTQTYLYKETSTTNAAPTQLTYAKGTNRAITALAPVVLNNTSYLGVGTSGSSAASVELLSDLATTPTSAGTMHANLVNCRGMIQTFTNDNTVLFDIGTSSGTLYSLPGNVAIGTAPTATLTSWIPGGYPLGLASLGGGPVRAYWLKPTANTVGNGLPGSVNDGVNSPGLWRGQIISTNLSGTDPQRLTFPLSNIQHAANIRGGFVVTDETQVIFNNGRYIKDLGLFRDRPANSNRTLKCVNFYRKNNDLYAEINEIAATGGSRNTKRWIERYDWDLDSWTAVSAQQTCNTTGVQSYAGSLEASDATGFLHIRSYDTSGSAGTYYRIFQAPAGVNPWSYRKTSSATAASGMAYEPSAVATWPEMMIQGFEGCWFMVNKVTGPPIKNIGFQDGTPTTPAKVSLAFAGITVTFNCTEPQSRVPVSKVKSDWMQTIQPVLTSTQQTGGTDPTLSCPNSMGWILEGVLYREPLDIPTDWKDAARAA